MVLLRGSPNWNPLADISGSVYCVPDGRVNYYDLGLLAEHFGESYSPHMYP